MQYVLKKSYTVVVQILFIKFQKIVMKFLKLND